MVSRSPEIILTITVRGKEIRDFYIDELHKDFRNGFTSVLINNPNDMGFCFCYVVGIIRTIVLVVKIEGVLLLVNTQPLAWAIAI